jgi:hypothetical protein
MAQKSAFVIDIEFDPAQGLPEDLHPRIYYYGKDLWHAFRDEPRISLPFETIDRATDRLHFTATSVTVAKRAALVAKELLSEHKLVAKVTVPTVDVA